MPDYVSKIPVLFLPRPVFRPSPSKTLGRERMWLDHNFTEDLYVDNIISSFKTESELLQYFDVLFYTFPENEQYIHPRTTNKRKGSILQTVFIHSIKYNHW